MFCSKCGKAVQSDEKYCSTCGNYVGSVSANILENTFQEVSNNSLNASNIKKINNKKLIFLGIGIGLGITIVIFICAIIILKIGAL